MNLRLTHEADLEVPCPACGAAIGAECFKLKKGDAVDAAFIGPVRTDGLCCFSRRMANLMRDPEAHATVRALFGESDGDG